MKPLQQRAIRTRKAILRAARNEFSAKGFHGARVDVIAAKAGINKQRLYANFTSKAGLFTAVLKAGFVEMVNAERHLLDLTANDIPNLTALILGSYVGIHNRHPELWRLLAWENLDKGRHASVLAGLQEPIFKHLETLYREGQAEGYFQSTVPFEGYIFTLLAVSYFMASNRHTLKESIGLDPARPEIRDRLCASVVRQLNPPRRTPRRAP